MVGLQKEQENDTDCKDVFFQFLYFDKAMVIIIHCAGLTITNGALIIVARVDINLLAECDRFKPAQI